MSILDQILGAEMANEYTDIQRLAYTEKKVLTFDGKSGNRVPWGNEGVYITRVSGEFIDFNSVEKITLTPAVGDPIVVKATPETTFVGTLPGSSFPCMYGSLNGNQAPVIAHITDDLPGTDYGDVMAGTYLCSYENQIMVGYISRVEYGETVHKIDPKYIPNTTYVIDFTELFPKFDLVEALMTALVNGGTYSATGPHTEMEKLQRIAPGTAVFVSTVVDGSKCVTPCSVVTNEGVIYQFGCSSVMTQLTNSASFDSIQFSLSVSTAVIVVHAEIVASGAL